MQCERVQYQFVLGPGMIPSDAMASQDDRRGSVAVDCLGAQALPGALTASAHQRVGHRSYTYTFTSTYHPHLLLP